MENSTTMKVLIDQNVRRNAVVYQSLKGLRTIRWGVHDITLGVLERQARSPRDDETFRKQLPYLATVADLARAGRLRLFSSFELDMERWRQRSPGPGYVGLDMLKDGPIEKVASPAVRTMVIWGRRRSAKEWKDEQMHFFRTVRDSRFQDIRNAVADPSNPDAHIADAFHLWNAEVARLDTFLTMDSKFVNVMHGKGKGARSQVQVLSPKELCVSLGEGPTDIATLAAKYPHLR